jgi:hypothetical protein
MAGINPLQLIGIIKKGNPQQIAQQLIQQNFSNNPMMMNLYQMGVSGNYKGVENFARQYLKQQGKDLDQEMANFAQFLNSVK